MENAFLKLLGEKIDLIGAGRTDTGVHAKQMLAHFDAEMISDVSDIVYRLNAFLPSDIAVQDIFETNSEAHARFDAISRTYEYWIVQEKNPFLRHHAHYIKYPLDIDKMNKAAQILLENTDFECFSKSNTDVYTFLCNISQAKWKPKNDVLVFTITADRFLRNMVRAIVGTLLEVGLGKMELETVNAIIKSKNRSNAGVSVPAKGLYLTQVIYPEKIKKIDG
jgi:tRNA pseudouridine38-40 synthase